MSETGDNPQSDQTLWLLAVRDKRDRRAFASLFDFYAPRIKAMAMRGGMTAAQAEDLVQDVMLTIWRKAGQYRPERAQASGWIYQIARNRQIDIVRKENRPVPEELAEPDQSEPDANAILEDAQEATRLHAAIRKLPESQRDVLMHAYLGELTHAEIVAATGLPLGTIKSRIRLGLERLRNELKALR